MRALYFGTSSRPLYGVYDPARGSAGTPRGAVLCYPLGIEYMTAHRAFRQMAKALAKNGVHVLRFDYSGTGDSWGAGEDASVPQWVDDIDAAVTELMDMSGVARISLVGYRMGALLAGLLASRQRQIRHLVLWDPVIDGREYATQLLEQYGGEAGFCAAPGKDCRMISAQGFEFSERLLAQIGDLDLTSLPLQGVGRVDVVSERRGGDRESWASRLREQNVDIRTRSVGAMDWGSGDGFSSAVLNPEVMREIVDAFQVPHGG